MPGLRDILDAATPDDNYAGYGEILEALERERDEWRALALDMGEALTEIRQNGRPDFGDCGAATCEHPGCLYTRKYDALLARLDQLGKEQT